MKGMLLRSVESNQTKRRATYESEGVYCAGVWSSISAAPHTHTQANHNPNNTNTNTNTTLIHLTHEQERERESHTNACR